MTVSRLAEALLREGVMTEVWELADVSEVSKRVENGIEIFQLPSGSFARLFKLPASTRRFLERRRSEVDLLHLHSAFIPANVWLARDARLPYVVAPHGGYSPEVLQGRKHALKTLWMRLEERLYVQRAKAIHAVSSKEADELRSLFPDSTVVCIPNGADAMTEVGPASAWTRSGPRELLFLGRLAVRHKGLDLLLEGFARFLHDGGQARLIIAGPDFRGGRAEIEKLARTLGVSSHVELPGAVFGARKTALLQQSFAFAHTSRWDGMPLSVLEALGAGCPPLITPGTNLEDDVGRYGAGVVVQPDPASIAKGIKELMSLSEEDYELMCKKGLELVRERFTWASAAEATSRLYGSIVSAQASAA